MPLKFYLTKLIQQMFIEHYYLVDNLLVFWNFKKTSQDVYSSYFK